MSWNLKDASIEIERLTARLRAAEDVCVMFAWMPTDDTDRGKAAHELWLRWMEISGNDSSREANPHLTEELIAELAAKRDATRAATLARIAGLMGELPISPEVLR